jgi:hypothetical protein
MQAVSAFINIPISSYSCALYRFPAWLMVCPCDQEVSVSPLPIFFQKNEL